MKLDAETLAIAARDDDVQVMPAISSSPSPEADPWERDLATALADVRARIGDTTTVHRRPLFHDAATLFREVFPPAPWLVAGLITRGGIAMLGAEPKSGKTWLATEIAMAVSSGTPVCGEFFAERGTVAYFYAEDLGVQIRNRLRALAALRGIDPLRARECGSRPIITSRAA